MTGLLQQCNLLRHAPIQDRVRILIDRLGIDGVTVNDPVGGRVTLSLAFADRHHPDLMLLQSATRTVAGVTDVRIVFVKDE